MQVFGKENLWQRDHLGGRRNTWEDNIKMGLLKSAMRTWTDMAYDRARWRTVVNAVMKFRVL
jgi:hypothetical protein